jgi:hypothetical protein
LASLRESYSEERSRASMTVTLAITVRQKKSAAKDAGGPAMTRAPRAFDSAIDLPIRIYRGSCRNNRS